METTGIAGIDPSAGTRAGASPAIGPEVGDHMWLDGELVPTREARISVLDHAITVGDGAFETIPVFGGTAFALTRHLARLRRTLAGLGLRLDRTDDEIRSACAALIRANGDRAERLRITVTGGVGPMGSDRAAPVPMLVIGSTAGVGHHPTTAVVTVPWCRNERGVLTGLKTTSYGENVVALAYARERGATEVLFANTRDELCEGTGSNVFVSIDGGVVTPPVSSGCLAGITRELVIGLVRAVERPIRMPDLARATEMFLTSSTRNVQPVHHIDDRSLPAPGPLTVAAQAAFAELISRSTDP